jgi:hypothetical protein
MTNAGKITEGNAHRNHSTLRALAGHELDRAV